MEIFHDNKILRLSLGVIIISYCWKSELQGICKGTFGIMLLWNFMKTRLGWMSKKKYRYRFSAFFLIFIIIIIMEIKAMYATEIISIMQLKLSP